MGASDLLTICISAFISVFVLLSILAVLMRIVIQVFPEKAVQTDIAMIAAVATVVTSVYPGSKITKIEEIK